MNISPLKSTIIEILWILIIFLSLGVFLLIRKKQDTSNSYIHFIFKPIDYIIYYPKLNIKS